MICVLFDYHSGSGGEVLVVIVSGSDIFHLSKYICILSVKCLHQKSRFASY